MILLQYYWTTALSNHLMKFNFTALAIFICYFNIACSFQFEDRTSKLRTIYRIEKSITNKWEDQVQMKLLVLNGQGFSYPKLQTSTNLENSYFEYLIKELINKYEKTLLVLRPEYTEEDKDLILSFQHYIASIKENATTLANIFKDSTWTEQKTFVNSIKTTTTSLVEYLSMRMDFIRFKAQQSDESFSDLINELSIIMEESKSAFISAIKTYKVLSSGSTEWVNNLINKALSAVKINSEQTLVVKQLGSQICPECDEQRQSEIEAEHTWQVIYLRATVSLLIKAVALTVFCVSIYAPSCAFGLVAYTIKANVIFYIIYLDAIKTTLGKWI
ncbi:hypothetical protein RNJ44_02122 [Nakaseomyces bracarensis]|uniref:Uncharacterized protein n=1 Tax=Nakaseomyces bracarensis TaxID=273131 RepID=A0ABR4NMK9_9SACH